MGEFDNRICIITGAGSEIGRACALAMARRGARIVLADDREEGLVSTVKAIEVMGGAASYIAVDLTETAQVDNMLQLTRKAFGVPGMLVNCAEMKARYATQTLHSVNDQEWNSIVSRHLTGIFGCVRKALPLMQEGGGGSVVNVLSILAVRSSPEYSAFSAAQGGILSLTRSAAVEYAPYDIRVNAVMTGFIKTDEYRAIRARKEPEFEKKLVRHIPMKRLGSPNEVAGLAAFLLGDDASYITGAAIPVDGGYSVV